MRASTAYWRAKLTEGSSEPLRMLAMETELPETRHACDSAKYRQAPRVQRDESRARKPLQCKYTHAYSSLVKCEDFFQQKKPPKHEKSGEFFTEQVTHIQNAEKLKHFLGSRKTESASDDRK